MSLPITAVGPLNVETNPILMESAAVAGVASARAVAPASQNAVLILLPSSVLQNFPPGRWSAHSSSRALRSSNPLFQGDGFCARNRQPAASKNHRLPLRTFGSCLV